MCFVVLVQLGVMWYFWVKVRGMGRLVIRGWRERYRVFGFVNNSFLEIVFYVYFLNKCKDVSCYYVISFIFLLGQLYFVEVFKGETQYFLK